MSLTVLKRKSNTKYGKISSRGNNGFSLNNPRRVDSHSNKVQTQTPMKGTALRGHGSCCGQFKKVINNSQYKNYDSMERIFVGNQGISVKNNHASISTRYKWIKRGYPYSVFKDTNQYDQNTASLYTENKATNAICKNDGNEDSGNANLQDSCENGSSPCKIPLQNIVKSVGVLSQSEYIRSKLLDKNCLPPPEDKQHFPVVIEGSCNTNCNSAS
jgi:hypothetical protein